jgi:Ecdysteroid kinase-like family
MGKIPVEPLAVTATWLSEVLEADVRECELEQIAIGVGLLGRLFRAHLVGGPDVPATVVIKLPTLDTTARTNLCEELEFYLREVRFYEEIGLANPLRPARPYFAAFDEATHDFVLVLEDLGRLRVADQIAGCSAADAETVIDAIARHHAHWWDNDRLASLSWLKAYRDPPLSVGIARNYKVAWTRFVERAGPDLFPTTREYGERFASSMSWFLGEISRPPRTFLHGDLRLDQLFFAVDPDDAPVTAVDWQVTASGRGAYDLAYFLSQSLTADTRRSCEDGLLERYIERLADLGIDYPVVELRRDYRIATAWCFIYPVMSIGRIEVANGRQSEWNHTILDRSLTAIDDLDCWSLGSD